MKKIAIYPGTFDPITFGHIDVIKKALKLFDKVVVAASDGTNKKYLFNSSERIDLIDKALFTDLKFDKKKFKRKELDPKIVSYLLSIKPNSKWQYITRAQGN